MNDLGRFKALPGPATATLDRLLLLLLVIAVRAPSMTRSTIDQDEGIYLIICREILAGHWPYTTVFLEKPLGAQLLMALNAALFGTSVLALRILGAFAITVTTWIIREIALAAGLSRRAALASAILYAVGTIRLGGLATNLEILFIPLTASAVWTAYTHLGTTRPGTQTRAVLVMGVFVGLAVWAKYVAGFTGSALFAWLVGTWLWNGTVTPRRAFGLALLYGLVCSSPTVLGGMIYAWHGQWDIFWYSNFGFMPRYRAVASDWGLPIYFLTTNIFSLAYFLVLATFGWIQRYQKPDLVALSLIWLAAEAIALAAPMKFFDHYFLMLLPPLCLLGGIWVDTAAKASPTVRCAFFAALFTWLVVECGAALAPWNTNGYASFLTLLSFALISILLSLRISRQVVRTDWWNGSDETRQVLTAMGLGMTAAVLLWPAATIAAKPDPAKEVARIIQEDHGPGASLWIANTDVVIYLLTDTPVPTRYVFPHFLTGRFGAVANVDQAKEVTRILATNPLYLIADPDRWNWTDPIVLSIIREKIASEYQLQATVGVPHRRITVYKRIH